MTTFAEAREKALKTEPTFDRGEIQEALEHFKPAYSVAQRSGQEAVNVLLWNMLEDDENIELLKLVIYRIGFSLFLRRSLLTAPVLNTELLEVLMRRGLASGNKYSAFEVIDAARRTDLTAEQTLIILENLSSELEVAIFFKEMQTPIDYDLVTYLYCGLGIRRLTRRPLYPNNWKRQELKNNLESCLLQKVYDLNPELPETWVKQMLNSLRENWIVEE